MAVLRLLESVLSQGSDAVTGDVLRPDQYRRGRQRQRVARRSESGGSIVVSTFGGLSGG